MRSRTALLLAGIAVLGLIAAACGDDDDAETPTATSQAAADTATVADTTTEETAATATPVPTTSTVALERLISVNAVDVAFDTAALEAKVGEEVTINFFNFDDQIPHSFHLTGPGGFDEKTEIFRGDEGRSRKLVFNLTQPGTYSFVCDVHASMTGTMTVE